MRRGIGARRGREGYCRGYVGIDFVFRKTRVAIGAAADCGNGDYIFIGRRDGDGSCVLGGADCGRRAVGGVVDDCVGGRVGDGDRLWRGVDAGCLRKGGCGCGGKGVCRRRIVGVYRIEAGGIGDGADRFAARYGDGSGVLGGTN